MGWQELLIIYISSSWPAEALRQLSVYYQLSILAIINIHI